MPFPVSSELHYINLTKVTGSYLRCTGQYYLQKYQTAAFTHPSLELW